TPYPAARRMGVRIPPWAPRAARRRPRLPEGVRRCEEASSDSPLRRLVYIRTGRPAVLSWSEYRAHPAWTDDLPNAHVYDTPAIEDSRQYRTALQPVGNRGRPIGICLNDC